MCWRYNNLPLRQKYGIFQCATFPIERGPDLGKNWVGLGKLSNLVARRSMVISCVLLYDSISRLYVYTVGLWWIILTLDRWSMTSANTISHTDICNSINLRQNGNFLRTTFSNAFSWIISFIFRLKFHWRLFLRVRLENYYHGRGFSWSFVIMIEWILDQLDLWILKIRNGTFHLNPYQFICQSPLTPDWSL